MAPQSTIETLNALPLPAFRTRFFPHDPTITLSREAIEFDLALSLETASTISPADMTACFDLISHTSSADYAASSIGWSPAKKRKEMCLPDLRYILVKQVLDSEPQGRRLSVEGFLSFMLTYEDGCEVVYCYEIHLSENVRGRGLGKRLMVLFEDVGRRARIEKAMLTVFKANEVAMKFYERLGYEEDEYSPGPRKLRGGIVKEPDYVILSKMLINGDMRPTEDGKELKAG